ncbi:MAG: site-specific integrase [Bacteroidales bacterium]|nr:site-specific integrase [Bacteroidales bacterium]
MAITNPTAHCYLDKRTPNKNNKYPVKLNVYYLGKNRLFGLPIKLTGDEWKKIYKSKLRDQRLKDIKTKLDYYEGEKFDATLREIEEPFTFQKFKTAYEKHDKSQLVSNDVYVLFDKYIEELEGKDKVGTAQVYRTARISFQGFRKRLYFNQVTIDFLSGYEKYMRKAGRKKNYIAINLRCMRAIYNRAIAEGLAKQVDYPFSKNRSDKKYKIKSEETKKKALSTEQLSKLKQYEPQTPAQRKAFMFWWFALHAYGINMTNICHLKNKDIVGNKIIIERIKTEDTTISSKPIRILITPEIQACIDEYGNQDKSPDAYVFSILKHGWSAKKRRDRVQSFTHNISKHMTKISEDLGFERPISTNWARHSFSTFLKSGLIPIEVISEALGHSSIETTQIYLDSFEDDVLEKIAKRLSEI